MSNLKSQISKVAAVRIKRGLSRLRSNSEVSVTRSLETKPAKIDLFPTSPPQDQTRFPSPVTVGRVVTSLAGLPPTVSTVKYTADRHSGVSVVLRAFRACVSIGRNFFSPPPGKLRVANRETVSKSNLDEELFV